MNLRRKQRVWRLVFPLWSESARATERRSVCCLSQTWNVSRKEITGMISLIAHVTIHWLALFSSLSPARLSLIEFERPEQGDNGRKTRHERSEKESNLPIRRRRTARIHHLSPQLMVRMAVF